MTEPFRFFECVPIIRLTGRRTNNVFSMIDILKDVSPECIFHHVHQYFLRPEMQLQRYHNDFAIWVANAIGDRVLSERLANINPFAFPNIEDIRMEIIEVMATRVKEYGALREALPGNEFFFNEATTLVFPSGHEAGDLPEFYEALKEIDCSSVYFHFYEARLRVGRDSDDFSFFLGTSLGLVELAASIGRLDPYMYDTETLREKLLKLIKAELS